MVPLTIDTAWKTPGGMDWVLADAQVDLDRRGRSIVNRADPASTRRSPHVPSATLWFRRKPAGSVDSSNGPAVRTTVRPSGSSARSHSGQSRSEPM